MLLNYQALLMIYKQVYKDVKKKFERFRTMTPFAVIFTSKMHVQSGQETLKLGGLELPVEIIKGCHGTTFEVQINNEDDESKSLSFEAVQALAEAVEAECILIVGEVWIRTLKIPALEEKGELSEAIQFSFQSEDGSYHAHAPIMRKGRKVKLPPKPPALQPVDVLSGRSKVF